MLKKNKIILVFVFVSILLIFFSDCDGCKDNPVVPPPKNDTTYQFDSSRFNWKVDSLYGYNILYAYALDTIHIYMASPINIIYYDGNKNKSYNLPNNFYPQTISGLDDSHIFIGGWINQYPYRKPAFLVFDGVSFKQIMVTDTVNASNSIYSIYVKNLNEIWLGLKIGIIKYDGANFKYYSNYNTIVNFQIFEQAGQLYCFSYSQLTNKHYFLQYENDNWNTVYSNSMNTFKGSNLIGNNFYELRGDEYTSTLYKFAGTDMIKILDVNKFRVSSTLWCPFAGISISDLLLIGELRDNNYENYFFHWNGNNWSKEIKIPNMPLYAGVFNNIYTVILSAGDMTYVFKGIKK